MTSVLVSLVSFKFLEKLDAKLASKDDIIASTNEKLLLTNAKVDSMTQEIEKLVDEVASKDAIIGWTNAKVDSMTQEIEELVDEVASKNDIIASLDAKLASTNEELLLTNAKVDSMTQVMEKLVVDLASNEASIVDGSTQEMKELLASKNILIDGLKAIIMRETELICKRNKNENLRFGSGIGKCLNATPTNTPITP